MDYEQKYKEALKRADSLTEKYGGRDFAEYVFPELAESEDERIRKAIRCYVEDMPDTYGFAHGIGKADMLAWLEKQKEQKPLKVGENAYFDPNTDMWFIKKEQKPAEWSEEDIKKLRSEEYTKGFNDAAFGGKLKEWSEEVETKLNDVIRIIETNCGLVESIRNHYVKFLKSLRPSWKPSEEQIYSLGTVVKGSDDCAVGSVGYNLKSLYEDLKKLKED